MTGFPSIPRRLLVISIGTGIVANLTVFVFVSHDFDKLIIAALFGMLLVSDATIRNYQETCEDYSLLVSRLVKYVEARL